MQNGGLETLQQSRVHRAPMKKVISTEDEQLKL